MLSRCSKGSAARPVTDRTWELTSHIAWAFLHLCKESGGLYGPFGPVHPWNSVALEGEGVGGGVCIFWVLTQFSVCVEEVGREHL